MTELKTRELFADRDASLAYPYLLDFTYPWEALGAISEMILAIGAELSPSLFEKIGEDVWVARSARVAASASIAGPAIICEEAELRQGAFLRGGALVGRGAVVGNSTELKNCILFDRAAVPHFNYVGDSILGYRAHMGAGAVTSNVKNDKTPVRILYRGERIDTGRKKLGAMIGDLAEVGCGSVLNPGTVIGRMSRVYPLSSVRGYVPGDSILKSQDRIVKKQKPAAERLRVSGVMK